MRAGLRDGSKNLLFEKTVLVFTELLMPDLVPGTVLGDGGEYRVFRIWRCNLSRTLSITLLVDNWVLIILGTSFPPFYSLIPRHGPCLNDPSTQSELPPTASRAAFSLWPTSLYPASPLLEDCPCQPRTLPAPPLTTPPPQFAEALQISLGGPSTSLLPPRLPFSWEPEASALPLATSNP